MLRAILIDDEKNCTEVLKIQLETYCPEVEVVRIENSPEKGIVAIRDEKPDIVFLDVEMPTLNGFGVLERTREIPFEVIFTTAHQDYAIQAIRYSALDYLVKPVQPDELKSAVARLADKKPIEYMKKQLDLLLYQTKNPQSSLEKVALSTSEGLEIVNVEEILYCEAQSNYTMFHFTNTSKTLVSKPLKQMEELLNPHPFYRVHQTYLVNLRHVQKYVRSDGGYLILPGNIPISVANSRKEGLVRRLQNLS